MAEVSMAEDIDRLRLEVPAGFARERTTVTFRVPPERGFADARIEHPIRPNLVVHRRAGAVSLAAAVAEVREKLGLSIPGLSKIESSELAFADGAVGVLLSYRFPAARVGALEVCQLQALRVDDGVLTTLTLTTEGRHLDDAARAAYRRSLASATLRPPR
jgi:hypothetical protein